jgi:hypothetical protein
VSKFIDITGWQFVKVVPMWPCGRKGKTDKRAYWLCTCSCGAMKVICGQELRTGKTKSCGCLREENRSRLAKARTKHGHRRPGYESLTYISWRSMLARCRNTKHAKYKVYGRKGVRVCDRWRDFRNFLADMGPRPEGTTLGRILDRGDYEPGNAFWMTRAEQGLNVRNNHALSKWESLRATMRKPPVSVGLDREAIA